MSNMMESIGRSAQSLIVSLVNAQREQLAHEPLSHVQFNLPLTLPPLPDASNLLQQRVLGQKPRLSLMELASAFRVLGDDARVQVVLLNIRGFAMPIADLQTLRDAILRLRQRGKRVVAYAQSYDNASYYVASACDEILLQAGGELMTVGLIQQQVFLKDALDSVGLKIDPIAISPYKSATDLLARSEPSDEEHAMTNWLLDSVYGQLVAGIAAGRQMSAEAVQTMIDSAPHTDLGALEAGYVDGICSEEGLYAHLKTKTLVLWEKARTMLPIPWSDSERYIAVLPLSGTIINGESGEPPVSVPIPIAGDVRMGDITVVQQIRHLMHDDKVAALILAIDSGGGSASASEAIASALEEFQRRRPLLAAFGSVAASGGYYIATPAERIFAQPGTITGSIGVILAKLINSELFAKLHMNPVYTQRGAHAGLLSSGQPFSASERAKLQASIERIYEQFLQRVADARKMKPAEVDAIGGGRVWTGAQALENGLVDAFGGLYAAIQHAKQVAGLPDLTPIHIVRGKSKPLPAQVAQSADPAAALRYAYEGVQHIANARAQLLMPTRFTWR